MNKEIIEAVKQEHTEEDFNYHIKVVVKNALKLAELIQADKEVVEPAAWLHDIGRAHGLKPSTDNMHHRISAEKAEVLLNRLGYPKERAEQILACILSHRGNKDDFPPITIEQQIVANADAMAHFDSFLDLFKEFLSMEDFPTTLNLIDEKIERDWNKKLTLPEAKNLVREKYNAIRLLIDSIKEVVEGTNQ